jgi:3-deoxy-manno-octulosonate cytidylyltransferase (CMP-KDO synthetase)
MKPWIIIPVRMESIRLYGKPLLKAGGKTLLEWTCLQADKFLTTFGIVGNRIIIATDSEEIKEAAEGFGCHVFFSSVEHPTGTHRCIEALADTDFNENVIINWQVDEPMIPVDWVFEAAKMVEDGLCNISTIVARQINDPGLALSPDSVKAAVSDYDSRCLWFSRQPISNTHHMGLYVFNRKTLQSLDFKPTRLSIASGLEQLAWIEHHYDIYAYQTRDGHVPLSVNTREDLDMLCELKDLEPMEQTDER